MKFLTIEFMRLIERLKLAIGENKKLIDFSGTDETGASLSVQPEKLLAYAVVNRAVSDAWNGAGESQKGIIQPLEWITSTADSEEAYTFGWCAEQLSEYPESFKEAVLNDVLAGIDYRKNGGKRSRKNSRIIPGGSLVK